MARRRVSQKTKRRVKRGAAGAAGVAAVGGGVYKRKAIAKGARSGAAKAKTANAVRKQVGNKTFAKGVGSAAKSKAASGGRRASGAAKSGVAASRKAAARGGGAARRFGRGLGGHVNDKGGSFKLRNSRAGRAGLGVRAAASKGKAGARKGATAAVKHVGRNKGKYAAGAAGVAVAGGAAYAYKRRRARKRAARGRR